MNQTEDSKAKVNSKCNSAKSNTRSKCSTTTNHTYAKQIHQLCFYLVQQTITA